MAGKSSQDGKLLGKVELKLKRRRYSAQGPLRITRRGGG